MPLDVHQGQQLYAYLPFLFLSLSLTHSLSLPLPLSLSPPPSLEKEEVDGVSGNISNQKKQAGLDRHLTLERRTPRRASSRPRRSGRLPHGGVRPVCSPWAADARAFHQLSSSSSSLLLSHLELSDTQVYEP